MASEIRAYAPFYDEKLDLLQLSVYERAKHNFMRLIMTPKGTDSYDPDYGASPREFLFDLNNNNLLQNIENEIKRQVDKYEAEFSRYIEVEVGYYLPGAYGKRFIMVEAVLFNISERPIRIVVDTDRKKDFVING